MRLSDREIDCIILHNAGFLAQKRLSRALKLNYPEAIALISSQVCNFLFELEAAIIELFFQ
jgi:urease gamma subunit